MLDNNQIQIDGDGNITLQNIHGSTVTIQKSDDATAILAKLNELQHGQLDALQQIIEKQTAQFSDLLKMLLKGITAQKNIVSGSISQVGGNVRIGDNIQKHSGSGDNVAGDKIIYNYNIIQPKAEIPKELTIDLPQVELSKIIGRGTDLKELRTLLQEKQKVVVVNGLGGIGKTTLAQAYVTQFKKEYAHILWLSQSESDNFVLDLITAKGLTHNLNITTEGKDVSTIFSEIIAKLKSITAQPNLFVIDNANASLHQHFNYLPKPPNWHVLATSREKIEHFEPHNLDFLSEPDAISLFKEHCNRITDEAAIRSVLKTIDYHTLTIEILAKTAERHDTPLATLQQAIEKDLKSGVHIEHKGDKIERVTSYLLSIFELNTLSTEEQRLLQHFAALPSAFVPYQLLKTLIPADEDGIAATLQDLTDKGWLLKNDPESYKMHLIIREVVLRIIPLTVDLLHGFINNVTSLLNIDQTKDNPVDKFPFIPYGEAVLAVFPDATDAVISYLQNNLGLRLSDLGDYAGAKVLLEKAMISAEANFGEKHPSTARSYSNLATVLQALGDYSGAKVLLEKAMISAEANFGEKHPTTAVTYSNLATVLQALGDYNGAKVLLEKAMLSNEANFGEKHPFTARSYSILGLVLRDLGDYAGAKVLLEKAMLSDEANFGEKHPTTAVTYSNLATVLRDLGDYAGAKVLLEKAMLSDEANFSEKHPNTAVRYSNLAMVLQDLGDYAGAKALLEKAMLSDEANFGEKHPNTAVNYSNLGNVLKALGDYAGAKALLKKAMLSAEANFGEKHPTTAVSYSNLAMVLQALGDYAGAKVLLEKAMLSDEANFGEKHPTTAVRYSNLATVLQALGDYVGAKVLLEKAMLSDEANFGEKHPTTAVSYSNLGLVLKDLGDYNGAKVLLEKAMLSAEANFGEKHPTTAVSYSNLATVLHALGDYNGAKVLLEKAMLSAEANFGEKHPTTAVRYSNLATVLQDLGDYAGAKVLLEKAMLSDEANFGEKHPTTAVRYSNLAWVLKDLKEYEKAIQLAIKAYRIYAGHLGQQHPDTKIVKENFYAVADEMLQNGWTMQQIQTLLNT